MKAVKYILFVLLSLFITGVGVEILLGIAFYIKDQHIDEIEVMEVRDYPYLYYLFKPGEDLNEHGFKTPYTPADEKREAFRVVLLGGSVARGYEPDSTIAVFLEKQLQKSYPSRKIQVINAGISAYVIQQELILLQNIGMQYQPDLVIGLDGYNDVATQWYNRFYDSPHALPPHHWYDFSVIRQNQFQSKPYSRFAYFFKNIDRVKAYLKRKNIESKLSCSSQKTELQEFKSIYQKITLDTKAYCSGWGIPYFQFIQPLQFYRKNADTTDLDCRQKRYYQRYLLLDQIAAEEPFVFSLSESIPQEKKWWKDECHVVNTGNARIASKIADNLDSFFRQMLTTR